MATETMAKTKWTLDPIHSEVGFKVKHMMITNVSGSFGQYGVKAETDGNDFSSARFEFTASAESISTGNTDRDKHLKSGDFFDSAQYPELKSAWAKSFSPSRIATDCPSPLWCLPLTTIANPG